MFLAWMMCWLAGWVVVPPLMASWLPPRDHRVWRPLGQRLMQWPLFPARARLVWRLRCRCCAVWARPALLVLDLALWPWFAAVTAWEARNWRGLDRLTPNDEPVPGSDEDHFTPTRNEP